EEDGEAPKEDRRSFVLIRPPTGPKAEREREALGRPQKEHGQQVVTARGLDRAGIYYLTAAEGGAARGVGKKEPLKLQVAVVTDLRESASLETMSDREIDEVLGFRPVHVGTGANGVAAESIDRTNYWTLWLLLGVLALAAGESLLAWQCDRAR